MPAILDFPPCDTCMDAMRNERIVRRTCLNEDNPRFRRLVNVATCSLCKNGQPARNTAADKPTSETDGVPAKPSLAKRILTYTQAVAEWIAAGRPERSDEEVQHIYKEHCEPCSWRKRRSNVCRGCGCRVAAYGMAVTNKIKMATQHCPRNKW